MTQPQNFTNAVFENNLSEYETIGDRTLDEYDNIEMQPKLTVEEEKDEKIFPDTKHKTCLKKRVCIGISIAVIAILVIVIAVMAYVFLSSKAQGGSCKAYTDIRNGQIIRSTGSRHGDTLEIQCDKNSKLNGSSTVTCLSSGVWSVYTQCVPKECRRFALTQHMAANSNANLTIVGSIISLLCQEGFNISGNSSVICQRDEEWSDSPTCKHVDCGYPMVIRNAKQYRLEKTSYNSSFTVECIDGYTLIGTETVKCNLDGKWDVLPVCEIVSCGTPNIPAHASITNLTGTSFQSTVTFKCDEGYLIDGNSVISCTSSGNWTDLPSCKDFCESSPCQNGSCVSTGNNYTCICSSGFEGLHCETVTDFCESSPCQNGSCVSTENNYTCICAEGFWGLHCEKDFCESSPCQNGSCVSTENNYTCICSAGFWGVHCEKENLITDCLDIFNEGGITDGIYTIRTWKTHQMINVYCDMTTAGGGWTVFQYRFDKSVNFNKSFEQYESGFGDVQSEFWLGLKYIQEIASQNTTKLRIDLEAKNSTTAYATFSMFELSPRPAYALYLGNTISSFNIHTNNRIRVHNGSSFSTFDNDVDSYSGNCASLNGGGWWYTKCYFVDLNGYVINYIDVIWNGLSKSSKMMIRRN